MKINNNYYAAKGITFLLLLLILQACGGITSYSVYKNAKGKDKTLVLSLIHQTKPERIQEIVSADAQQQVLLLRSEYEIIAKRLGVDVQTYRNNQIRRVQTATVMYSDDYTRGIFTDKGRIYIKYGEPDSVKEEIDNTLGQLEIWNYKNPDKQFVFLIKEHRVFKLYNLSEEDMF